MSELRWNPILGKWIIVAAHRQNRPQMPKDYCPFCPGSGKVPANYDVHIYANDFPSLHPEPLPPTIAATKIMPVIPAQGVCDVILYSSEHTSCFAEFTEERLSKIFNLWANRFDELSKREYIKYIYIFENKGDVIGVTMPHPHGQLYAYPFIPPRLIRELECAAEHWGKTGQCLFCALAKQEQEIAIRLLFENEDFIVFLPPYAEYPYEVHLYPRRHIQKITDMNERERTNFMLTHRSIVRMYDSLFGFELPFMMAQHSAPVDGGKYAAYFHFHVEFYPLHRAANNIKYNAGSETGAGAHINPSSPEQRAEELRQAFEKSQAKFVP